MKLTIPPMIVSDLALVFHILLGNSRLLHPFKGFYRFSLTDDLRLRLVKTADIHTRLFEVPLADKVDISLTLQDFWKRLDEGEDFIRIGRLLLLGLIQLKYSNQVA